MAKPSPVYVLCMTGRSKYVKGRPVPEAVYIQEDSLQNRVEHLKASPYLQARRLMLYLQRQQKRGLKATKGEPVLAPIRRLRPPKADLCTCPAPARTS